MCVCVFTRGNSRGNTMRNPPVLAAFEEFSFFLQLKQKIRALIKQYYNFKTTPESRV